MAKKDPVLCAEMLFVANSSCLANPSQWPVKTLEDAWERVDAKPLLTLIVANNIRESVRRRFMHEKIWKDYLAHSRAISQSCHILAGLLGMSRGDCEIHSVAGLMHDIGRAIIMIAADNRNASLMGTSLERMRQVIHDEKEAYSLDHCQVGEQLFRRWHFASIMQEGILRHHTPLLEGDFSPPGAIIFISHFVSMSDFTGDIIANMLGPELIRQAGMDVGMLVEAKRIYESATI